MLNEGKTPSGQPKEIKINSSFDDSRYYDKYFKFTENNTVVEKFHEGEGLWFNFPLKETITIDDNIYEFEFKLIKISTSAQIMMGFVNKNLEPTNGYHNLPSESIRGFWSYYLSNGKFYNNGDISKMLTLKKNFLSYKSGDKCSICIDLKNEEMYIKKNGEQVDIPKKMREMKETDKNNLCAYVELYNANNIVSIVNN